MTREKEIQHKAGSISDGMIAHNISQSECKGYYEGYIDGANWADNHPKSPWISVNDDLPCNHKELLLSTGYHTRSVLTYKKGGACNIDNMIIRNGKWGWETWKENYLYWMPIPKLPKE